MSHGTEGAVRTEPNAFELCRVAKNFAESKCCYANTDCTDLTDYPDGTLVLALVFIKTSFYHTLAIINGLFILQSE